MGRPRQGAPRRSSGAQSWARQLSRLKSPAGVASSPVRLLPFCGAFRPRRWRAMRKRSSVSATCGRGASFKGAGCPSGPCPSLGTSSATA
eukprot:4206841-Lingulodinium_polyedra.AAC.1